MILLPWSKRQIMRTMRYRTIMASGMTAAAVVTAFAPAAHAAPSGHTVRAAASVSYTIAAKNSTGRGWGDYTYDKTGTCLPGGASSYDAEFSGRLPGSSWLKIYIEYNQCRGGSWEPKSVFMGADGAERVAWAAHAVEEVHFWVCTQPRNTGPLEDCVRMTKA